MFKALRNILKKHIYYILIDGLLFLFSLSYFYFSNYLYNTCDIAMHNKYILSFNKGEIPLSGHFFYFIIISILSLQSKNLCTITLTSSVVLSIMIIFKRIISESIVSKISKNNNKIYSYLISLCLVLLTNMPSHPPFKSEWPPITWINSTTIFVFPFCILLFWYAFHNSMNIINSKKLFIKILLLSILTLFIKPNYIFTFIVSYPIFLFLVKNKNLFPNILIIVLLCLLIGVQYLYIYKYLIVKYNFNNYQKINIVVDFFSAWHRISRNIIISALLWFSIPLSILFLYYNIVWEKRIYLFAVIGFIVSLLIFITFEEVLPNGKPYGSVNFLWQVIISLYIWTLVSLSLVLGAVFERKKLIWKDILIFIVLFYNVFASLAYYVNTILSKIIFVPLQHT